jgi:hypothetical protein
MTPIHIECTELQPVEHVSLPPAVLARQRVIRRLYAARLHARDEIAFYSRLAVQHDSRTAAERALAAAAHLERFDRAISRLEGGAV